MANSTPTPGSLTSGPGTRATDLLARKPDVPVSPMLGRSRRQRHVTARVASVPSVVARGSVPLRHSRIWAAVLYLRGEEVRSSSCGDTGLAMARCRVVPGQILSAQKSCYTSGHMSEPSLAILAISQEAVPSSPTYSHVAPNWSSSS